MALGAIGGPLISAGADLLGGLLGKGESERMQYARAQKLFNHQIEQQFRYGERSAEAAFGRSEKSRVATQNWNKAEAQRVEALNLALDNSRVQRLVKDARAAGIHPLAALGANLSTPLAMPVQSSPSGSTGTAPQGGSGISTYNPRESLGNAVSNAGRSLAGLFTTQSEQEQLQNELLRSQIAATNADTAISLQRATSRSTERRIMAAAIGGPSGTLNNRTVAAGDPKRILKIGGKSFFPDPSTSQANDIENEYGDAAEVINLFNMISGTARNIGLNNQKGYMPRRTRKRPYKQPSGYKGRPFNKANFGRL